MAANWDIRRIYMYLVCFATLMMIIVGTVQVINGIINLVYPEPFYYGEKFAPGTNVTAEERARLEKEQAKQAKTEEQRQKIYRIRSLATSFALLGVSFPVYLYHWRKIQRSEAT